MIILKLRNKIKSLIKVKNKKDGIDIKPYDVYLVSFPKSGNTWMRFLLINYLFNPNSKKMVYDDLEVFIPSIHKSSIESINSKKGLRIIKSHIVKLVYPKIIYIVRDGRDALVSYYYYQKELRGFKGSFEEFYFSKLSSEAGNWEEHLRAALKFKKENPCNIIFVKYEDLKTDTNSTFKEVISFLGEAIDEEKLNFAINSSSFDNLKKMQLFDGVEIENKNINFFRKGISEQWKGYFTEKINNDFMKNSKDLMEHFNYI